MVHPRQNTPTTFGIRIVGADSAKAAGEIDAVGKLEALVTQAQLVLPRE